MGCSRILAIVNDAAKNIGVHMSFQLMFLFSLGKYPILEFLDPMVFLVLIFFSKEPPYCVPEWPQWCALLSAGHKGSLLSTSSPALVFCLFKTCHSDRYNGIAHCSFDLHLPDE